MIEQCNQHGNRSINNEAKVLLLCARTVRDPDASRDLLARLNSGPNWDSIVSLAREHAISPLLYHSLREIGIGPGLAPVLHELHESYRDNTARNLFAERELTDVVTLLEHHGIAVVPFKGPLLATMAYGKGALREYGDLDILVKRDDVQRAEALLRRRGYRPVLSLSGFARSAYLRSECAIDLVNADQTAMVELHWDLMPLYFSIPFDLDRLWRDLEWTTLNGVPVRSLAAPDLLLFLCLHGAKHRWEQLRWICDVAELIRSRPDLDWDLLLRRADSMGSRRMLLLGVLLAAELLDARPPADVVRRASEDRVVRALAGSVCSRMFAEREELFGERNRFYLRVMESPWQRARYGLHVLTVPTKHELAVRQLPPMLSILHYPLHVLGVLGQALDEARVRALRLTRVLPADSLVPARDRAPRPRHAHN